MAQVQPPLALSQLLQPRSSAYPTHAVSGETPYKLHICYRIRPLQFQTKAFRISHFHSPTT